MLRGNRSGLNFYYLALCGDLPLLIYRNSFTSGVDHFLGLRVEEEWFTGRTHQRIGAGIKEGAVKTKEYRLVVGAQEGEGSDFDRTSALRTANGESLSICPEDGLAGGVEDRTALTDLDRCALLIGDRCAIGK